MRRCRRRCWCVSCVIGCHAGQRTVCVTIATTLLDPVVYPKEKITALYQVRWSVETHFAELRRR